MESETTTTNSIPRLACNNQTINPIYDVIVIGSGYGGAIAACRAARAHQGVCVLEKGKEWLPGEFPVTLSMLKDNTQVTERGKHVFGTKSSLFDVQIGDGITVLSGVGMGGRSLIDAGVCYEPNKSVFQRRQWPSMLRKDIDKIYEVDAEHVNEVLSPKKWPNSPPYMELQKSKLIYKGVQSMSEVDIEDLDKHIKQLPLSINFQHGKNPFGIEQPACNGCGNCLSGCNVGAKNSLNLNYLANAKAHGAHIFTETEASVISRDSYTGLWSVEFNRESKDSKKKQTVKARLVFLAAGVAGSVKILYQSKEEGLSVSQKLGQHVTFNGTANGLCKNLADAVQGVGLYEGERGKSIRSNFEDTNPGPTTTVAVDLCTDGSQDDEVVISELTLPAPLKSAVSTILSSENNNGELHKLIDLKCQETDQNNDTTAAHNVLSLYATGGKQSVGEITFNADKESISISKYENNLDNITSKLEELSKGLGGEFLQWPKDVIPGNFTMHPLGGCIMGETGHDGVVNHKGQVFIDNTSDVHEGLYVIDSSTIPSDINVSPTFTICMLAERCMRLCAADFSWRMSYDVSQNVAKQLASHTEEKRVPGILFSEKMVGNLTVKATGKMIYCDAVLDIQADNVISMIELDPEHTMNVKGTVTCLELSKEPLAAEGTLNLLRDSKEQVDGKEMIYSMALKSVEGRDLYFFGIKYVHLDHLGETGLSDTTTLHITIYAGQDKTGDVVGEGVLCIRFEDFAKQLTTINVTNTSSVVEKWKLELKFVKFFLRELWDTYFRLCGSSLLNPDAPPRKKRPLNLGPKSPEFHKVITEDKIELRLTRFQGGKKGPIMLIHGLGVASSLFLVDTVQQNFVEFLIQHKYDVWLFDWRASLLLPWACYTQYTVDECANYDFSAGVDKILEITGEKDVQLVIHCFGAIAAMASVLLGKLEGKVRCILSSQVCATPIGSMVNKFKSQGCLSSLVTKSGLTSLTAYVDENSPWSEKTLNFITRNFAFATTKADQHCSSEVCHRITFLYGLLFEHGNLNVATHDIWHELFGVATTKILSHIALITRKERIVSSNGKDIYLPGYKKKKRLTDQRFRRKMDLLNIPIMFFNGERNQCWNPENLVLCYNMVREANPTQDYVYFEAEGYGHLDTFLGKRSHLDIYPRLLQWLDKYADNNDTSDTDVRGLIYGALNPADEHTRIQRTKSGNERLDLIEFDDLDDGKEIKANDDDHDKDDEINKEETEILSNHEGISKVSAMNHHNETRDVDESEVEEEHLLWPRKVDGFSCFQDKERYKDPVSTEFQLVVIKSFKFEDDLKRRDIIAISDLHLGSDWSRNIKSRLESFIGSLAKIAASSLHTIVLMGNIFDMESTAVAVTPPTKEEFILTWKKDETVMSFASAIRQLATENDVFVYYVRGDSDHDMTEEMAKELLGDAVQFIRGCLIYKLCIGNKLYTIRFEHGHSAGLFNDYSIQMFDTQEVKRPFSYFVKRLLFSTEERFFFDSKEVINKYVKATLDCLPVCFLGSTFIDVLGTELFSRRFCKNLAERAIGKPMTGDECIIMEEGKWIRLRHIFESKFLHNAVAKYGSSEVYEILKSSIKDLSHYVMQCHEDVVVLGHLHRRLLQRVHGKGGDTIYANTGTWIDLASHNSYVKIQPPKTSEHGAVELIIGDN